MTGFILWEWKGAHIIAFIIYSSILYGLSIILKIGSDYFERGAAKEDSAAAA